MERVGGGIWWIPPLPGATTKWPWKIGLISPYAYLCLSMTSCGSQWLEFPVLDKGVTDLDKHYEDDSLTNSPKNAYEDRKHNIPQLTFEMPAQSFKKTSELKFAKLDKDHFPRLQEFCITRLLKLLLLTGRAFHAMVIKFVMPREQHFNFINI